jgi:hypothetical protein
VSNQDDPDETAQKGAEEKAETRALEEQRDIENQIQHWEAAKAVALAEEELRLAIAENKARVDGRIRELNLEAALAKEKDRLMLVRAQNGADRLAAVSHGLTAFVVAVTQLVPSVILLTAFDLAVVHFLSLNGTLPYIFPLLLSFLWLYYILVGEHNAIEGIKEWFEERHRH